MKWKGRRSSSNIEDARGRRMVAGGAGAGLLLNLVGRRFGIKGMLVLLVIGVLLWQLGLVEPEQMIGGQPRVEEVPYQASPEEQQLFDFVAVVLADTEDVWRAEFSRYGRVYEEPVLQVYSGQTATACGMGQARMGPFYCPADRKVYIDLAFYDELEREFAAPGDFAQAYVIAHEIGHHVQNLLGTSDRVQALRDRPDYKQQSVRLELQADYYAGVWASRNRHYLDRGDIEEAMRAANAIGDDTIQQRTQGRIVPHAFTHGTSEQRMRWFDRGFDSGSMNEGDTFSLPYDAL